jgi:lipoic acid synthetase
MDTLVQLAAPSQRRPPWLRIRLRTPERFHEVRRLVESQRLHTVCEEARCPNIYECWGEHGTATFMILGDVCTRRCGFCAVTTGKPAAGVDADEPRRVAEAVQVMGLRHTVITSVDRDDLADGGAHHFADVIAAVRDCNPQTAIEVLTPDFRGAADALDVVLEARPEVFSHNMETVPRLYRDARPGSEFDRSLTLLAGAAERRDHGEYGGRVKTGLMLGLGEDDDELRSTLARIRDAGVEILTLGQYLQPTREHLPVRRWVHPDEFVALREFALGLGFAHCEAGPLVRSSYHAHEHVAAPSPAPK